MIQCAKRVICTLLVAAWLLGTFPAVATESAATSNFTCLPTWFALSRDFPIPHVDPEVAQALATHSDSPLRIIVTFPSADSPGSEITQSRDALTRRTALVKSLQTTYEVAQAPFETLFAEAQSRGEVLERRDLWIIRGVALIARPQFVRQLINTPGLAEIRLDEYTQYLSPSDMAVREATGGGNPTWGLTQIRAPEVWASLGISGTGAVVAIVDTGVDFLHPALANRYYGNLGLGRFNHAIAWYDVVNGGIYPYDDEGHGTHVAGTVVGEGNIGVAPGAQWMGVKVLDGGGGGYESWVHAGFQWILAPGGDPARAPDVVNNSWGTSQPTNRAFETDIQTLLAADIFPVFAAGNEGPEPESLRAPASLPGVFAVGANDADEDVASFSSRGPSPWGETKPYIVAPGVNILSALPGGVYGQNSGTSMATPHVVGVVALMRAVSPTIAVAAMAQVLTETSVPLTTTTPNNDSGWGRLDSFAAVVAVARPGLVTGTVRGAGEGGPLSGALIQTNSRGITPTIQALTDAQGHYTLALTSGLYDISAAAFGYQTQTHSHLRVTDDSHQALDFELLALPSGVLQGRVTVLGSGVPPTRATSITVLGAPVSTVVDENGNYQMALPAGVYEIEVRGLGYQRVNTTVAIVEGHTTICNVMLSAIPTILLVDEGAWYYDSRIQYWKEALESLAFTYDEVRIKHPPADTPISTTLAQYDIVLWSSPEGSPGLVAGDRHLRAYLNQGGKLFLSGDDVAYYDGGKYSLYEYLYNQMSTVYIGDTPYPASVSGLGPFAGLTLTLHAKDSVGAQAHANTVQVVNSDKAQLLWRYPDGSGAAVGASTCVSYSSLLLSFGYETIEPLDQRREVLKRSIDWLLKPPDTTGLTLSWLSAPTAIGSPGEVVTHFLRLQHTGYAGTPDNVTLSLESGHWPTTITPGAITVSPCTWVTLTVVVTIPKNSAVDVVDISTVTVHSSQITYPLTISVRTKTPATVLLVDDDRWYPMEEHYIAALQMEQIPFDVWDTLHSKSGSEAATSPTAAVLQKYPIVIWFNGYDWLRPILTTEMSRLLTYLNGGGRVLLSSQEFLYVHAKSSLVQRFGVSRWYEDQPPLMAAGIPGHPAGGRWGWDRLSYPFSNWSDAIEPLPEATPLIRNIAGQPLAIANVQPKDHSKTVFAGFPLETLPLQTQAKFLASVVGWFSPLGDSTWELTPTTPQVGERVTGTVVLYNDADSPQSVALSQTLPAALALSSTQSDLWPSGLDYDAAARSIRWQGTVLSNTPLTLTWVMTVINNPGYVLTPTLRLTLPEWKLAFTREAFLHIAGNDLIASQWIAPTDLQAGKPISLLFAIRNTGISTATGVSFGVWLMEGIAPLTQTLPPTRGILLPSLWEGELKSGEIYTVAVPVRAWIGRIPLRVDALLEETNKTRWEKRQWLVFATRKVYLPLTLRGFSN